MNITVTELLAGVACGNPVLSYAFTTGFLVARCLGCFALGAVSQHCCACISGTICAAIDFATLLRAVTNNPAAATGA